MSNTFKDPVVIPFKIEREFKNILVDHCSDNGMIMSALIRKLLKEYAQEQGLIK